MKDQRYPEDDCDNAAEPLFCALGQWFGHGLLRLRARAGCALGRSMRRSGQKTRLRSWLIADLRLRPAVVTSGFSLSDPRPRATMRVVTSKRDRPGAFSPARRWACTMAAPLTAT